MKLPLAYPPLNTALLVRPAKSSAQDTAARQTTIRDADKLWGTCRGALPEGSVKVEQRIGEGELAHAPALGNRGRRSGSAASSAPPLPEPPSLRVSTVSRTSTPRAFRTRDQL